MTVLASFFCYLAPRNVSKFSPPSRFHLATRNLVNILHVGSKRTKKSFVDMPIMTQEVCHFGMKWPFLGHFGFFSNWFKNAAPKATFSSQHKICLSCPIIWHDPQKSIRKPCRTRHGKFVISPSPEGSCSQIWAAYTRQMSNLKSGSSSFCGCVWSMHQIDAFVFEQQNSRKYFSLSRNSMALIAAWSRAVENGCFRLILQKSRFRNTSSK